MFEQVLETLIGVERGAEAGELAHRPELPAIACRVNASRIRRLARVPNFAEVIDVGNAVGRVQPLHWRERDSRECLFGFWSLKGRPERTFFPFALGLLQWGCSFSRAHPIFLKGRNETKD